MARAFPGLLAEPDGAPAVEPLDPYGVLGPLGRSPATLMDLTTAWSQMDQRSVQALAAATPASVVLVGAGLVGDEGPFGLSQHLKLGEGLATRRLDDPDAWTRRRDTRRTIRLAPGPTITPRPDWRAAWASADAHGVQSPFPTAGHDD